MDLMMDLASAAGPLATGEEALLFGIADDAIVDRASDTHSVEIRIGWGQSVDFAIWIVPPLIWRPPGGSRAVVSLARSTRRGRL